MSKVKVISGKGKINFTEDKDREILETQYGRQIIYLLESNI